MGLSVINNAALRRGRVDSYFQGPTYVHLYVNLEKAMDFRFRTLGLRSQPASQAALAAIKISIYKQAEKIKVSRAARVYTEAAAKKIVQEEHI